MTALYVHIGHHKTGSTFLQNTLALSTASLRAAGCEFPVAPGLRAKLERNPARINSGNGSGLFTGAADRILADLPHPDKLILSSETLYFDVEAASFPDAVARLNERYGPVRMLLFVRDPVELLISGWQQSVKRHGGRARIETFFGRDSYVGELLRVLERLRDTPGIELTVQNYSRVRRAMVDVAEAWLGIPGGTLTPPPVAQVNRSLTQGELSVQLFLNRVFGKKARIFADRMCQHFPDRMAAALNPPADLWVAYREASAGTIGRVNAILPDEAALQVA